MRLLGQFGIILFVTFLGEVCHLMIPLPVPASIYGMALMFLALYFRLVRLRQVKAAAYFLLDIMPPMFIPAGVGLVTVWAGLREVLLPVAAITLLSTLTVMAATGRTAQALINRERRRKR